MQPIDSVEMFLWVQTIVPLAEQDPTFQIYGHNASIAKRDGFYLRPRIPIFQAQSAFLRTEHNS